MADADQGKMDEWFRGRCHSEEKAEWERAAKAMRRSLSDWIRITLNDAAAKTPKKD